MSSADLSAIVPLSLLEAIRTLDAPIEDGLQEHPPDVVRRLGLNATVTAQIARYERARERGAGVGMPEVVQVFRLVSRRPDAELAFADAGRRAARFAMGGEGAAAGGGLLPGPVRRRLRQRRAARLAREVLAAELTWAPNGAEPMAVATMSDAPSVEATGDDVGCGFYAAALGELLRLLTGFEGTMVHEDCRSRGAGACRWRAVRGESYA